MANQSNKQLPKLADLHRDINEAYKNDELNLLLNQPPNERWIKNHPLAKVKNDQGFDVPSRYIPIDKIEFLLTCIFQRWRCEVLQTQVMFNAVVTTVRLWVNNPISGEWTYHDGIGACNVQTDKGFSAADLGHIKAAAVQMAAPASKAYALKDAAEHLGALFGRDLNRRDVIMFSGKYERSDDEQPEAEQQPRQELPITGALAVPQQAPSDPILPADSFDNL